jgi:hypothetical protein
MGCIEGDVQPPPPPEPPPVRDLSQAAAPRTLEEALTTLQQHVPASIYLDFAQSYAESVAYRYHDSLGRWIRNNWGLYQGGPLCNDLRARGLVHADDMSGVILTSFWRQLHDQPLKMKEQVSRYQKFSEHVLKKSDKAAPQSLP